MRCPNCGSYMKPDWALKGTINVCPRCGYRGVAGTE